MKIKIINLGRNKINKIAEVNTEKGLVNDCLEDTLSAIAGHYLLSSDIAVEPSGKLGVYSVYAGFIKVGEIEVMDKIPMPLFKK